LLAFATTCAYNAPEPENTTTPPPTPVETITPSASEPPYISAAPDTEPPPLATLLTESEPTAAPSLLDGMPDGAEYLGIYRVYGYNWTDGAQVGKAVADGITASGASCIDGYTAAADKSIPFGTRLYIVGYGEIIVQDRGVKGQTLDVAFNNNAECYKITGDYEVYVLEWGT
jgi:3D (Asp-Asp-Asp) domain-containing protein